MTNRQRFFMNGIMLTAVGLAIRSVSLGFNSYITQSIGAEGIGLFTLISTVYSFAVTFATSGISLTVTRIVSSAVGEGREREVRGILRSAVAYSLIFSIFSTCVLFFGADYFAYTVLSDGRCRTPLRILALSLVPIALSSVFTGYFVGVKRVSKNAVVQIFAQVFKIAITVSFVFRFARLGVEEGTVALCLAITLTEISVFAVALLQYVFDKRKHFRNSTFDTNHIADVSRMALPLAVSAYIRSVLLTLEHILIPKRLRDRGESHSESLASYGVLHGMALPMLLYPMAPLSSFSSLLVPEFAESLARGERERMRRMANEAINTTLAYSIAAAVLVSLFSEELGYIVYDSYSAGHYIAMMAPVLPIMYLDHVTDSMLKGIGEHVFSMWVNISDSFLSIILVWFLIPKMGIAGYAVVIVAMEGYNFILSAARLYSKIKFRIYPVKYLLAPAAAAAASAVISKKAFADCGSMTAPVWLFLEILFAVCTFVSMYLLLNLIIIRRKQIRQTKTASRG